MKKIKILVVEDDEDLREVYMNIFHANFEVEMAINGIDGLKKAIRNPPNIILVDIKMPEMDGFQFCKAFREEDEYNHIPIIVVSAFNKPDERMKLFEIGVDDYLTKPFNRAELLIRVQKKLQRADESTKKPHSINENIKPSDELKFESKSYEIQIGKKKIALSFIEFKLLRLLADHKNQLVSREEILELVWEKQVVSPKIIAPHILAIRRKLSETSFTIQVIYGKGYIFKRTT